MARITKAEWDKNNAAWQKICLRHVKRKEKAERYCQQALSALGLLLDNMEANALKDQAFAEGMRRKIAANFQPMRGTAPEPLKAGDTVTWGKTGKGVEGRSVSTVVRIEGDQAILSCGFPMPLDQLRRIKKFSEAMTPPRQKIRVGDHVTWAGCRNKSTYVMDIEDDGSEAALSDGSTMLISELRRIPAPKKPVEDGPKKSVVRRDLWAQRSLVWRVAKRHGLDCTRAYTSVNEQAGTYRVKLFRLMTLGEKSYKRGLLDRASNAVADFNELPLMREYSIISADLRLDPQHSLHPVIDEDASRSLVVVFKIKGN